MCVSVAAGCGTIELEDLRGEEYNKAICMLRDHSPICDEDEEVVELEETDEGDTTIPPPFAP